jgi:uncharacterized protein YegP (UPF0339 family)
MASSDDEYKPVAFYKAASKGRKRGFEKFTDGDKHYFALIVDGNVAMISQAYTSIAGRDNGVESVKKNMKNEKRFRFSQNAGKHGFGLFAGNGQEIAISPGYKSKADAEYAVGRMMGKVKAKSAKASAAKKVAPQKKTRKKAATKKDGRVENYHPLAFYKEQGTVKNGFASFSKDGAHYFTYCEGGKIVLISESYTSKAGRDNGIASTTKNMKLKSRYEHHVHKNGKHYFDINAANGQEVATSIWYSSSAAAMAAAASLRGEKPKVVKAAKAKKAPVKRDNREDNYRNCAFYEAHAVNNGFSAFEDGGEYFFAYFENKKLVWRSESYPTKNARDVGQASVKKNMGDVSKIKTIDMANGHSYRILKAGNGKEIARTCVIMPKSAAAPIAAAALATGALAAAKPTPADKDDDYLPCKEYHGHAVNDKINNVAFFKHSDGQFYFAMYDDEGDVRIRSEGFRTAAQRDEELSGVLRLKDNPKYYKRIEKGDYFMDVLYDETGREVGRSCLRKKAAPVVAAAPIAAAAAAVPAAAAAPVAAPAAATGGGFGWLKWLLPLLLLLLLGFLLSKCMAKPTPAPLVVPPKAALISCWDGSEVENQAACPAKIECWDGSFVKMRSACPVEPAPEPEPEVVVTPEPAPVQAVMGSINRICGPSNVTLFDVPNYTPKSVTYLGSNPQFGDSHGLTPAQFHARLAERASFGGKDRAFLNYMARSLGYGSFRDMDASMFSNEKLSKGEKGMLGFAQTHSLQYSKLNVSGRDLEAFRVRAANGQDVHFMKTCGNFMYVCQ